jgi:hypothetical protein
MQYINRFAADIRMSVAQRISSPDTLGQTPEFDDREGLYIGDYRVFMPLGALHYQAMVTDDVAIGNGNFQMKVSQLPNVAAVYNEAYGRTITTDPSGGYNRAVIGLSNTAYHATHGFVRMGDWVAAHRPTVDDDHAAPGCNAAETCWPYLPPVYGSTDAPTASMRSETVAGSCMVDRPSCTDGKNGRYSNTDGGFFCRCPW